MISRRRMMAGANLTSKGVVDGVIQDDWDQIIKICKSGKADQFYSEGDYKPLEVSGIGTFNMLIAGFKTDVRTDVREFCNVSWISKEGFQCEGLNKIVVEDYYASGKDPLDLNSQVVKYLDINMIEFFPAIIKDNIVPVEKYCLIPQEGYNNRSALAIYSNKIWIPGFFEYKYLREVGKAQVPGTRPPGSFNDYRFDANERYLYFDNLDKSNICLIDTEKKGVAILRDLIYVSDSERGYYQFCGAQSGNSEQFPFLSSYKYSRQDEIATRFGFCL